MSAPTDDDVVVHGDAERGGDVDDRFRHLDVRTRRRRIAARMVVHQDDRSIDCCTCLRQLMALSDMLPLALHVLCGWLPRCKGLN
jgi:hypothetical protein